MQVYTTARPSRRSHYGFPRGVVEYASNAEPRT